MGEELKKAGYKSIYGLDGSPDMLAIADTKGVYNWTWEVLVGVNPLPIGIIYNTEVKDSGFDAVFSAACMIKGHFPNTCFEEMLKVLRPGGYFIFSIRDIYLNNETDNGQDYVGKLAQLEQENKIIAVDSVNFIKYEGLDLATSYHEESAKIKIY